MSLKLAVKPRGSGTALGFGPSVTDLQPGTITGFRVALPAFGRFSGKFV